MKETITVRAEARERVGSSAVGRLRREGRIPAVVYSEGKPGQTVQVNSHDFSQMMKRHHGEQMLVDLAMAEGGARKVLLKDIQHHPVNGSVMHIDFYEVSMTRKLCVEVPLTLVGDPIGVTQQGGILDHLLRSVEIECLPADIPDEIPVDVSGLAVGRHLSVKDIQVDVSRYTIVTAGDVGIAAVSLPKAEEETTTAEGATGAEPEVLSEKKPEEGAAAEGGKEAAAKGAKEAPAKDAGAKAGKEKAEKK